MLEQFAKAFDYDYKNKEDWGEGGGAFLTDETFRLTFCEEPSEKCSEYMIGFYFKYLENKG